MQKLRNISYYGFWALLIYMPFHIFLSQYLSTFTGGLEIWKIAKDVVLFALTVFTICLVYIEKKSTKPFTILFGFAIAYAVLHLALWASHPDVYGRSAILGMIYNNRLPCFLLLGMGTYLLNQRMFVFSSFIKIVLGVSTVIALLGVLQYFLPKDLLTHFGYSLDRGVRPAFFIDDNPALPRIMSTLREPNALGAYLLLPITALTSLLWRVRRLDQRMVLGGMLGLHLLAVLLTFSRSAWLATAMVMGLATIWQYREQSKQLVIRFWPWLSAAVLVLVIVGFTQRNSSFVEQYITHASVDEQVQDLDSNDYHKLFIEKGLQGIADQPLGHGPGTAGLASIQDPKGSFLTENYYIQIGYEVGVLGLVLFIAAHAYIYMRLWKNRSPLSIILLVSFWGYVLTNMLLHTWSNEAVAAQWWLLAGIAVAYTVKTKD